MEYKLYPNYSMELEILKAEKAKGPVRAEGEAVLHQATDLYEVKELMTIAEAFDECDKTTLNPVVSYSTNLKIKELGATALANKTASKNILESIVSKSEVAVADAAEKANADQANSEVFNYYGWISDLQVASDTMLDISKKLNADPNLEAVMPIETEGNEQAKSVLDKIRGGFNEIHSRFENVVKKTGVYIGQAGKKLLSELGKAKEYLERNVVPKFIKAFKMLSDAYDAFRLKLFESMFDFVRKVVELASLKNWKIDSIQVGMPEIGLSMTDISGFKIPIPSIKSPPVSFTFKPS